ncbi:hypothetical protein B0I72DRAFT_173093 [Yarrowia lipolytica]|uniref:Uncharacterized protein n=1 Tax=Yarrowia lipolytica TaxID=4952 RepID=A0A371CF05_YARLL|nr:hypothetical protein B0I71DRAFT_162263 [Yarrowia lipolytica]RDW34075.1 hypothetical protein B0I72DRAFT_173093 [Yarrowia lipolytica]RDW40917.1 hypothetical protein B0I73DRAFT_167927 [Yarrowia lipolytica]RDW46388.1 hypothetical protein B0I74DRAFT_173631 [Yarrowia lipolytica]RDW52840.1 hypothetical protein B0I75DRAFT_158295 [Yarrowia lipolytica]
MNPSTSKEEASKLCEQQKLAQLKQQSPTSPKQPYAIHPFAHNHPPPGPYLPPQWYYSPHPGYNFPLPEQVMRDNLFRKPGRLKLKNRRRREGLLRQVISSLYFRKKFRRMCGNVFRSCFRKRLDRYGWLSVAVRLIVHGCIYWVISPYTDYINLNTM